MAHYRMERGWQDHPIFGNDAYSRRDAWVWLIEHAAWKPIRLGVKGRPIELQRGQLSYSTRFMAKAWGWSEASVRRFLTRLKTDAMIDAATDAGQLLITICTYDAYQSACPQPDAATDAIDDAGATQDRRKEERSKEGKEDPPSEVPEKRLFAYGSEVLGKRGGGQVTNLRKLYPGNDGAVLKHLQDAATKVDPNAWIGKILANARRQQITEADHLDTLYTGVL